MKISNIMALIVMVLTQLVYASDFPSVDKDIKVYDSQVTEMNSAFNQVLSNPNNKVWVKLKLQHMYDVDQYTRKYLNTPDKHTYSDAEKAEFNTQFLARLFAVDSSNTADLKNLLKIYPWFTISEFDALADTNAWCIVQHADDDPDFQKIVLNILDSLWQKGETSKINYAYLFDRVAVSLNDPTKRILQRYGTQGKCFGPGAWQPFPVEDPAHLDERRASVGLGSEADYFKLVKDVCH